jgi:hypothetical protein
MSSFFVFDALDCERLQVLTLENNLQCMGLPLEDSGMKANRIAQGGFWNRGQ